MNVAVLSQPLTLCRESRPSSLQAGGMTDGLERVERFMHRLARGSRIDRAGSMALEQLDTGGKRLRARLALHACRAFGVEESHAVAWAAAVEILHNATLVHDDIQDGDRTRRGEPTLWAKHGVAQAINAGDLLLMLPFLALGDLPAVERGQLSHFLADYATRIVRGQVEELGLLASGRLDLRSYTHAAAGKTGGLLALPVVGAACLGQKSAQRTLDLGHVFTELGVLFQLQDDIVDLFGDKGRGEVGCDIYEGKVSALVVAQIERDPSSAPELLEILARPRELTTAHDVARARHLFRTSGALDDVLDHVLTLERSVLNAPALVAEQALAAAAEELMALALRPIDHVFRARSEAAV